MIRSTDVVLSHPDAKKKLNEHFVDELCVRTPDLARLFHQWYASNLPELFREPGFDELQRVLTKHPSDGALWIRTVEDTDFSRLEATLLSTESSGTREQRTAALARRFGLYKGCIYVIRIDSTAWNSAVFRTNNSHIAVALRSETPCFYVGQTELTPEARFAVHSTGSAGASRVARLRCVELDMERTNAAPLVFAKHESGGHIRARQELDAFERATTESLRDQGFAAHFG